MSYYGGESSQWNAPGRQASWEQPPPPSRSGTSSTVHREEASAFQSQFEEVDRAADNLMKSGKMFGPGAPPMAGPGRRDSMPLMPQGRGYPDFDPRMGGGPQRHHSVSDYDGIRPNSASNLQGYYANQRFGPRPSEGGDSMMQAKRRMAAQRERELRNYHQEQQYNRNVSGAKSDRSLSPNAMSEEDRRELIARQHRALYGENSQLYTDPSQRPGAGDGQVTPVTRGGRGPSPLAFDPFGMQGQGGHNDGSVQMPSRDAAPIKDATTGAQRSRANSGSSPSSNPQGSFTLYDNAQQSSRTSTTSPGGSPPVQGGKGPTSGVAPIGTRPSQAQGSMPGSAVNKRSTTPLPSPLSFGYSASEQNNERSTSAASNPSSSVAEKGVNIGWGSSSGVWGQSKNLGVQASVWG